MEHFSSSVPIFHLSLPEIWQAHPHENYIFNISKDRSISSQSLEFWSWKLWTQEAFEIGWFLLHFYKKWQKSTLVVEWLSWLPYKRDFINYTILET